MAGTARWVGVIHGRAVGDAAAEVVCACGSTAACWPLVEVRRWLLSRLARMRVAAGAARWGLLLGRSAWQADCTAMLAPGSCRRTHCAPCGRSVQTTAASQTTKRAGARRPWRCASRRPRHRPQRTAPAATTTGVGVRGKHSQWFSKGGLGQAAVRLRGAERRGEAPPPVRARLCRTDRRHEELRKTARAERTRPQCTAGSRHSTAPKPSAPSSV